MAKKSCSLGGIEEREKERIVPCDGNCICIVRDVICSDS